ncbi:membrane protein insertase YidC [Salinispirillum sp. LH 10-3-1]|uniref:Membrane protein insertase YidC n=1 Tax=Salinispirillum sp. LH 10-3-1 TaxID=2952525 RepID=A0AB38YFW0_9GAMM
MDWRRLLPIIGLAAVSYMLVLQWSEFDNANRTSTSTVSSAAGQVSGQTPGEDDLGVMFFDSETPTRSADTPAFTPVNDPASEIIIETDKVIARVQLQGGDITELALRNHTVTVDSDEPLRILESNAGRTFIAQSGLIDSQGRFVTRGGQFTVANDRFVMTEGSNELRVPMTLELDDGSTLIKTLVFHRGRYDIDVEFSLNNASEEAQRYSLYGTLRRDRSPDSAQRQGFAMASYLGVATTTDDDRYKKVSFKDMDNGDFAEQKYGGWIAFLQHYFVSAWVPPQNETHRYQARNVNGFYVAGFSSSSQTVNPGASQEWSTKLYVGPKYQNDLNELADYLGLTVDYGWLWWAAQPLFKLMTFIQSFAGNWGLTIILLTLSVKVLFSPLSAASYRSMARMRKFAPKLAKLKDMYGDDRQKIAQETMKLYKKEKINPLGGCLPMLVQMPVFIALYWVFMESVELRHSPFIFWLNDLSTRDPYFILPLLFGASMFLQMQLGTQPTDPTQQKVMKFMPIIFTAMFLLFPSGLVLYWVVNNTLSIAQQQYINWKVEREDAQKAAAKTPAS